MKKTLLISLVTIFLLYSQNTCISYANTNNETGYISLNSSQTKEIEPNIARISFSVENTAPDAKQASIENNKTSNDIINALKKITSDKTDIIKTSNFSILPNYYFSKSGKREIKNYTAINSITVETKDIKKVASLIDTAIENGANRTEGLSYSLENEKSICNELYPVVLSELRNQANIIAQAAGSTVSGIKHINASCNTDNVFSNGRFYSAKAVMADSASGAIEESAISTPVEAGKVKIRVYINADFYVK